LSIGNKDGDEDLDNDGILNRQEFELGLKLDQPDTDEDGLSDGEEMMAGMDGILTDPLDPDTDGDGENDGADTNPIDPTNETPLEPLPEPILYTNSNWIFLGPESRIAYLDLENIGEGPLGWRVQGTALEFVDVSEVDGYTTQDFARIFFTLKNGMNFENLRERNLRFTITDSIGANPDQLTLNVVLAPDTTQEVFRDVMAAEGSKWRYSFWFGYMDRESYLPWWYHQEHGWIWVRPGSLDPIYYYDYLIGDWVMTSSTLYPWFYVFKEINGGEAGWLKYTRGGRPGQRTFTNIDGTPIPIE